VERTQQALWVERPLVVYDEGTVRILRLNRPETKNAFDQALFREGAEELRRAALDDSVRCVVLTGTGHVFSSGMDLAAYSGRPVGLGPKDYDLFLDELQSFPKPLVAAVNGAAVGLGFTLLGHADIVIAASSARFRASFVQMGLSPEAGSSWLLPRRLGWQLATDLFLSGRWLSVEEAKANGFVLDVVSDALEHAVRYAAGIASAGRESLIATKTALAQARGEAARHRRFEEMQFMRLMTSRALDESAPGIEGARGACPAPPRHSQAMARVFTGYAKKHTEMAVASVADLRRQMGSRLLPLDDEIASERVELAGLQCEVLTGPEAQAGTILYLHGGAMVAGSLDTHRKLAGDIARASGSRVCLLDYRLAPENPYPAALDDALSVYEVLSGSVEYGRDGVAIAGDSAGAGLAVAVGAELARRGDTNLKALVALCPWFDYLCTDPAYGASCGDPVVTTEILTMCGMAYLSDSDPHAVDPLRHGLEGLPPLLIHTSPTDRTYPDAIRLAAAGARDGVEVRQRSWPDLLHVWHAFAGRVPEASEALMDAGTFLRGQFDASAGRAH